MDGLIAFVYANGTNKEAGRLAIRKTNILHLVYGQAITGHRFKVAILLDAPTTQEQAAWIDERLPLALIPEGRVYRTWEKPHG